MIEEAIDEARAMKMGLRHVLNKINGIQKDDEETDVISFISMHEFLIFKGRKKIHFFLCIGSASGKNLGYLLFSFLLGK